MRVLRAYNFMRNDCTMDEECEWCGFVYVDKYAYNDEFYRTIVVPDRCCSKCGKNSKGQTDEDKKVESIPGYVRKSIPTPIDPTELNQSNESLDRMIADFKKENPGK
jgi:hypothetical protein